MSNEQTKREEAQFTVQDALARISDATHRAINSTNGLAAFLDNLAKDHTAFYSLADLINAKGGYFPSLMKADGGYFGLEIVTLPNGRKLTREMQYAELDLLALAYDLAQESRGDSRRAFRS